MSCGVYKYRYVCTLTSLIWLSPHSGKNHCLQFIPIRKEGRKDGETEGKKERKKEGVEGTTRPIKVNSTASDLQCFKQSKELTRVLICMFSLLPKPDILRAWAYTYQRDYHSNLKILITE